MTQDAQLVLVSNRGPATFERDQEGELRAMRGGGGLVTALTGLVNHRDARWVASAMTEEDAEKSREQGGGAFDCEVDGVSYRIRVVEGGPERYDRFYNGVANPLLSFMHLYLRDVSTAPDIRQ